jgi:integrase
MARLDGKNRGILEWPKESGQWWMRAYHNGKEKRCGPFPTKSEAKALFERWSVERRRCLTQGIAFDPSQFSKRQRVEADNNIRLGMLIDQYLAGCTARSIVEQTRYGKWWKKVRVNGRSLGQWAIKDIRTSDLQRLQKLLFDKGKKISETMKKGQKTPSTINRYFSFLRHLLYLAVREGQLDRNPVAGVRFFKEPVGRQRFLTEGEEMRLAEVMTPCDWSLVSFALHTGLRQSEQFHLRWEYVDVEQRVLTVPRAKSGESRHVQLNDDALTILRGLSSWMTSPWVFPNPQDSSKPRSATAFYLKQFLPVVKAAKLDGVVWHTLRHTFASRLVMKGVSLRAVQELMGHKTMEMTLRYSHLSPGYLHEAVRLLNQVGTVTTTVTSVSAAGTETLQPIEKEWLGDEDSNLGKQSQSLLSCR